MQEQSLWATGKPEEDGQLSDESDTEAYYGRLRKARELTRKAVESAKRNGSTDTAALWQVNEALREAEFGNTALARKAVAAAMSLSSRPDIELLGALALARSGDTVQSSALADKVAAEFDRGMPHLDTNGLAQSAGAMMQVRRGKADGGDARLRRLADPEGRR